MRTLQILNRNARFADSSGFISTTVGTVGYRVRGTYQVCFKDDSLTIRRVPLGRL